MASLGEAPVAPEGWGRTYKHILKIEVVGDTTVGKSAILFWFMKGKFKDRYLPTLGFTDEEKVMNVAGGDVKLQLWDINGRDEYRPVLIKYNYLKGAAGFLVVYDVTSRKSFENVKSWIALIHQCNPRDVIIVIMANKCDLMDKIVVTEEEEMQLVEEYGYDVVHTSAKLGSNISEGFSLLVQKIYDRLKGFNP